MIGTSGIAMKITAEDLALLQQGLGEMPNHPAHDLAVRVIDRIKGTALGNLPPAQAQVLLQTVMAPIALRAARGTITLLRQQVERLGGQPHA